MPSNTVYRLFNDKNGYTWIATDRGLVLFDGNSFEQINVPLKDKEVINFYEKNDTLWIFNYTGNIGRIDLNKYSFINSDHINKQLSKISDTQPITLSHLDKAGRLMLIKNSRNSVHYVNDQIYSNPVHTLPNYVEEIVNSLNLEKVNKGDLVFDMTTRIVGDYILNKNKIYKISRNALTLFFDGDRFDLHHNISGFVFKDGKLFIGFMGETGLVVIRNYDGNVDQNYESLIPNTMITDVKLDKYDNLWVSSYYDGIYFFPIYFDKVKIYNSNNSGLLMNNVNFADYDDKSNLMLGYQNGSIDLLNGKSKERYNVDSSEFINRIKYIYPT